MRWSTAETLSRNTPDYPSATYTISEKQYLKILNEEIQKLNGIIDLRIFHGHNYHREARRHKKLLQQLRKAEMRRSVSVFSRTLRLALFS